MSQAAPPDITPKKKSLGTGAKVGIGCGIGCLGLVLIAIIGLVATTFIAQGRMKADKAELAAMGMTLVTEEETDTLIVTEVPTVPSYYTAKASISFRFSEPVTVPIGGVAPGVEFEGVFEENVYGRGLASVTLHEDSVFKKNVDVKTLILMDLGATVEGEVTGEYKQSIDADDLEPAP